VYRRGEVTISIAMLMPRLGRDITAALLVKLALLAAIYILFFQTDTRPALDRASVARHLLGAPSIVEEEMER